MKQFGLVLLLISILSCGSVSAQASAPLDGKTVAVYFSKKAFHFDRPYHHFLSQFIGKAEGEDILIDDLKLQSLVAIGKRFSSQLAEASSADSAFFLNEHPEMARAFIEGYSTEDHDMLPIGASMNGVDLVLVINPLQLLSKRTPVVLTRSNRLVTTYDFIKHATLSLELWNPANGKLVQNTESCVHQQKKNLPEIDFDFQGVDSETGRFLELVFSVAVDRLETGSNTNCPPPVVDPDEIEE